MKILGIISDPPDPPLDGGKVRNFNIWPRIAARGVEVRIVGNLTAATAGGPVPGVPCEFVPYPARGVLTKLRGAYLHSYHEYPRNPALVSRVDQIAAEWQPDVIHAEELRMGYYLPCARNRKAPALQTLAIHNVENQLYESIVSPAVPLGKGLASRLHLANLRRYESHLARSVEVAFAYSERDRNIYQGLYPHGRWQATKNGADVAAVVPKPQPLAPSVLLVGTLSYQPNRRGLIWFLNEVSPRLNPEIRLTVAGSGADADLQARMASANVRFVNRPDSLQPFYDEHAIAIAPIFEGSGTRTKILEALAYERVVVTTTKGVEGLHLAEGEGVAIADTAESFADAIHRLATPEARAPIAQAGRRAVLERYDWSIAAAELLQVWRGLLSSRMARS